MLKTSAIATLAAAILGFVSTPCQAQHAVAVPLPIYPPTAAAAGMAHQHAQMLAALDTNHNGQLDPAEALAAQSGLAAPVERPKRRQWSGGCQLLRLPAVLDE